MVLMLLPVLAKFPTQYMQSGCGIVIGIAVYSESGYIINGEQLHMWHVYWHTSPINAWWVIWAYAIYMVSEGHICFLHTFLQ